VSLRKPDNYMLIIHEQSYPLILSNAVLHDFHLKIKYIKHWKSKFKRKKGTILLLLRATQCIINVLLSCD